ncbi:MAG: valine--tRNA ligase [Dehalococcoidia bacterium]|nr:valine--tRNA ligase [Dehalococcoidia bacterium]MDD5495170.1 valine--tRNA ligase [Dehalococcoidia bacterium]
MIDIPKAYESGQVEQKRYKFWMDGGYFKPAINRKKKPFTIIMPPPNVTGELHVGHALTASLEDIMIRWHRMLGDPSLWLPGVDHAGIATQVVVEKELSKEGLDRHVIGRDKFLERVWAWANKSRSTITHQHERLGASCDWSREKFTLDEGPVKAVKTAFVRLYNKGLIYRGERIINWCPRCRTALSDLEVQNRDITSNMWHMKYPYQDGSGYITVATTRPETYLGDSAVAVNPEDGRYSKLIGQNVVLPFINRAIPIIADEAIDKEFGTGMVKVTPAHDPVDFEISERHGLPVIHILNPDATTNENAGPYAGLDRFEARKRVVEDFEKAGLMEKIEPYSHAVPHCFRCATVLEPEVSLQWFVKIAPLAAPAIKAVKDGRIRIIPERFAKIYLNWMENIRDWCISRQLWWGHRIPVWYCQQCSEMIVAIDTPTKCPKCGGSDLVQDPDVLDTWFSSGLWPHSTLGWPDKTEDLKYFYPTSVMETGYDILFFWVARMIMMGIEDTGDIPFHTVFLHGLIRDEKGEKMSKMKGNVLNPLTAIDQYGCDALRFALTTGTSPGNDINMGQHRLEAGRNFANKIWNAGRYVLKSLESEPITKQQFAEPGKKKMKEVEDRWIISRLNRLIKEVDNLMRDFQFGEAEREMHDFLWGEFCDWYIEISKQRLGKAGSPMPALAYVLETSLRLLHPFMPFITEELWQNLKERLPEGTLSSPALIIAPYPTANEKLFDTEPERIMEAIMEYVRSIRNIRAEYKVDIGKSIEATIYTDSMLSEIIARSSIIERLAKASLTVLPKNKRPAASTAAVVTVVKNGDVVIPLAGMVDIDAEKSRLSKEMEIMEREIARLTQRLADAAFTSKAPAAVVEKEKNRLQEYENKLSRLGNELRLLG